MDQQSIEAGQQELQHGRQLLQRARQLTSSESFTEGLDLIAEMIRIGRRLNHRRFHGARSTEDVRELEGAASDLSRALLQAAAAKASDSCLARGGPSTSFPILIYSAPPEPAPAAIMPRIAAIGSAPARAALRRARTSPSPRNTPSGLCSARRRSMWMAS